MTAIHSLPRLFLPHATQIAGTRTLSDLLEQIHRTPILVIGVLDLCLSIAFLVLFIAAPDFKVFRAASIFLALGALVEFGDYFYPGPLLESIRPIPAVFSVETALEALHIRRRAWFRLIWPITAFALVASLFPSLAFVRTWPILLSQPIFLAIILIGFSRPNARDRLIAAAYTGVFLSRATLSPLVQRLTGLRSLFSVRGWEWPLLPGIVTLFGFVTLAIFVRDLVQDRREKQRLAAELEAARIVQQALIPTQIPQPPGLHIDAVYQPFGEVGGDFFQIIPTPSGTLIAIGDVSGKGMPAALLVSLLVGTLNSLASFSTSPSQLLAGLNRLALGRSSGGFTTCLILHAAPNGHLTLANAGHLHPWLSGPNTKTTEVPLDSNLPLGLQESTSYTESTLHLAPGQQLTLLTDGIVEARNPSTGELLGFDRTTAISHQSAQTIAHAAQSFGQDDDITVLTLIREQ